MKSDLPAAALRLLSALPVRTHEARIPERKLAPQQRPGYTKAHKSGRGISIGFGKIGKPRPLRVGRRRFASVTEAARKMGRSTYKIYDWLRSGEARYV